MLKNNQYGARWAFMRVFSIPDSANPKITYLKRLRLVQTPWFGAYIHWIYLPDRDRDLHDHPWTFLSVILRGGYREILQDAPGSPSYISYHARFTAHLMPTHKAHQINMLDHGTVTLVLVGPRRRQWGFRTPTGWVPWHEYRNTSGTLKSGPDSFDS